MKISKKLVVSSLASVMAISMVGAISGTVAWYQYNTRVTTSLIGVNMSETGILEITSDNGTSWKRDLVTSDILTAASRTNAKLTPVTFAGGNMTADGALPLVSSALKAYKNPEVNNKVVDSSGADYATRGSYATAWDEATNQDYIQFTLGIRARDVANVDGGFTQTAEDVYLTNFTLANIGSGAIANALRIHMAIDANGDGTAESYKLVSNTAVVDLSLKGYLDQDNDGICDQIGGYEWATHRSDTIVYGDSANNYTQNTAAISSLVAARDAGNNYAIAAGDAAKKLFTTPTTGMAKITFTIWVEGWDLNVGSKSASLLSYTSTTVAEGADIPANTVAQYVLNGTPVANNYYDVTGTGVAGVNYFTKGSAAQTVADWSGYNTDGAAFQLGLTFDVGRPAFAD